MNFLSLQDPARVAAAAAAKSAVSVRSLTPPRTTVIGTVLLLGPRGARFLMSEVPLYMVVLGGGAVSVQSLTPTLITYPCVRVLACKGNPSPRCNPLPLHAEILTLEP